MIRPALPKAPDLRWSLSFAWIEMGARGHLRPRTIDGPEAPRFRDGMTILFNVMFPERSEQGKP